MNNISITVATICLNAESVIAKTIESVLFQRGVNFEYIVLDGKSTDRTIDIVKQYQSSSGSELIDYSFISEEDNGIYDAMNKVSDIAKGKWILFLNAGDYFYTPDSLRQLSASIKDYISVIYGDTLYRYYDKYKPFYSKEPERITKEYIFCHQSVLTRKDLLQQYRFNSNLRICADYELYLKSYLDGYKFHHVNFPICVYDNNGYSSRYFYLDSHIERLSILYNNDLISHKDYRARAVKEKAKRIVPGFFEKILPYSVVKLLISPVLTAKGWTKQYIEPSDFYNYTDTKN